MLVQKHHYLFDIQRNNIAVVLEVTYLERLHRADKEVNNGLDYHISVQDVMHGTGGEACSAENFCTAGKGDHCKYMLT